MIQDKIKSWQLLKKQLAQLQDPCLKKAYMLEFRKRALNDWGFDPETSKFATKDDIQFDDVEKEIIKAINAYNDFGVKTKRELSTKEVDKAKTNMYFFIKSGGTLVDLPEDLRNSEFIQNLYFATLKKVYDVE